MLDQSITVIQVRPVVFFLDLATPSLRRKEKRFLCHFNNSKLTVVITYLILLFYTGGSRFHPGDVDKN